MPDTRTYQDRKEYRQYYEKLPEQVAKRAARKAKWLSDPENKRRHHEYLKEWRTKNPDKIAAATKKYRDANQETVRLRYREHGFKKRYGISIAERDAILASQGGCCAVCGSADPNSKKGWHVDHCHSTQIIRGVLCSNCNVAIGQAGESIERLRAMITYLEKHSAND